jgi:hypothetical protein
MPCDSPGAAEEDHRQLVKKHNHLTDLLCKVCNFIEDSAPDMYSVLTQRHPDLIQWWVEHQKVDAARMARERIENEQERKRGAAMAKLTSEERRLLGL